MYRMQTESNTALGDIGFDGQNILAMAAVKPVCDPEDTGKDIDNPLLPGLELGVGIVLL